MNSSAEKSTALHIYSLSEKAVTIEFGNTISEELMNRVNAFDRIIQQYPFGGLYTTVPAYATLSVFFDPIQVAQNADLKGKSCFEKVSGYLNQLQQFNSAAIPAENRVITIPVCYGGESGPDLEEVASTTGLSADEVIKLHTSATYLVHMIGFVPGFAYLGGMPEALETPRKTTPRAAIPAGSVGIAGKQTGVYPLQTPGGWQIIGRTPVIMFDATRATPSLLKAGDKVVFERSGHADDRCIVPNIGSVEKK